MFWSSQGFFSIKYYFLVDSSLTRFGRSFALFKSIWQLLNYVGNLLFYCAKFPCCKWPNIDEIIYPSGHTVLDSKNLFRFGFPNWIYCQFCWFAFCGDVHRMTSKLKSVENFESWLKGSWRLDAAKLHLCEFWTESLIDLKCPISD